MKAKLFYREKYIYEDGAIREMVLWQLPQGSAAKPHALKYRLYYGLPDGTCVVLYDNETGKGDHRHFGGKEELYIAAWKYSFDKSLDVHPKNPIRSRGWKSSWQVSWKILKG